MAVKIIKHGEKIFRITCPICGCEFEYEKEDILCSQYQGPQVKCPDCSNYIEHKQTKELEITWDKITDKQAHEKMFYVDYQNPTILWSHSQWPDCETCPNKPDPNKVIIGDTPCTWCIKNQPYCTTVTDLKYTSYTTDVDNENKKDKTK